MFHPLTVHDNSYESGLQIPACFISEMVASMNADMDLKLQRDFKALNNL